MNVHIRYRNETFEKRDFLVTQRLFNDPQEDCIYSSIPVPIKDGRGIDSLNVRSFFWVHFLERSKSCEVFGLT